MASFDIEKLKQIQLEMLKTIIYICRSHNICYFCFGGTALGAVRHNGFIPWDDDIDIAMKRKDYEQFILACKTDLPDYYFLQTHETDPDYRLTYAKLRDSRTTFIETSARNLKINHGVYIDIFILDGLPDDPHEVARLNKLNRLTRGYCAKDDVSSRPFKSNFLIFLSRFYFLFAKTQKVISKFQNKVKLNDFDTSKQGVCFGSIYGMRDSWPTSWFAGTKKGYFEGIEISLPIECEKYLTQVYGDFMELPPENKRIAHHFCDIVDFDKPFTFYIKKEKGK